jgi:hypothetical protein
MQAESGACQRVRLGYVEEMRVAAEGRIWPPGLPLPQR